MNGDVVDQFRWRIVADEGVEVLLLGEIDIELARRGFEAVKKAASSGKYDMLILDEINVAVDSKLIPVEDLIDFIKNKPPALDLVLTGRYAPRALVKLADTVSEVKEIRHHYAAGIKDRAGIEY